jgi:acyl carrier protein
MAEELVPDELSEKVIRLIAQTQRIPAETITINSTFDELKIDSLDGINIVFAVENEFNINIPDDGVQNLKTVREMIDGVRRLLKEKDIDAASGAA